LALYKNKSENLDANNKHIVIIEDDTSLLLLLQKFLQSEGYLVSCFEKLSTIEELIELKADCFLIDEHLPNVSGHIICILIKSKLQTKEIPVILMSAFEELEYFADISCADAFLKKPFARQELLRVISSMLSKA
jgi:DNA-binding response OmpR family regulator